MSEGVCDNAFRCMTCCRAAGRSRGAQHAAALPAQTAGSADRAAGADWSVHAC